MYKNKKHQRLSIIEMKRSELDFDIMEPFRWLVDITVVKIALRRWMKKKDFIETNEGNIRLRPNAVKLLLNELGKLLGMRVMYKHKKHQWSTIIEMKTRELMMYIDGRLDHVNYDEPKPNIPEGKWFLSI